MNNLIFKNHKLIINTEEQVLFDYSSAGGAQNIIGLSGYICNISNVDKPEDEGIVDFVYLKLYNTESDEETFILEKIEIPVNRTLPVNRIFLKPYDKLIVYSETDNNLCITFNTMEQYSNEYGLLKVIFNPKEILDFNPTYKFENILDIFKPNQYYVLSVENYNMIFSDITGWNKPQDLPIAIKPSKILEINVTYELTNAILSFSIDQIDIITTLSEQQVPSLWRIVDTQTWYTNNQNVILTPGSYEIEFQRFVGYKSLDNLNITLNERENKHINLVYILNTIPVKVILDPPEIRISKTNKIYNMWRIEYSTNCFSQWKKSGEILNIRPGNNYKINIQENNYYELTEDVIFNVEEGQEELEFLINCSRKSLDL